MSAAVELNLDGLVGPTHHYGGHAHGNLASTQHKGVVSNPRAAALQGIAKMRLLLSLGCPQGVLPPHDRPHLPTLMAAGYCGRPCEILAAVWAEEPERLTAAASASSMWAANAATVSPSADTADHRVHITPANLAMNPHRAIEAWQTGRVLQRILAGTAFVHHPPLSAHVDMADEGAANTMRIAPNHACAGIEVFVYGRNGSPELTSGFSPRQSQLASQTVAQLHGLPAAHVVTFKQTPMAIAAGVFHNDVIAVANENVLFVHQQAFVDQEACLQRLCQRYVTAYQVPLSVYQVSASALSLTDAVATYIFNSQIVTRPDGTMVVVAPLECREHSRANAQLEALLADTNPVNELVYADVGQSMGNGGGPACLRLRLVLTRDEFAAVHPGVLATEAMLDRLAEWVVAHYRDELRLADLADPDLLDESRRALDELTVLLNLGSIYDFQQDGH